MVCQCESTHVWIEIEIDNEFFPSDLMASFKDKYKKWKWLPFRDTYWYKDKFIQWIGTMIIGIPKSEIQLQNTL